MPIQHECPSMPARALLLAPASLSSLPDALARRAAIFGPVDIDPAPARTPRARQAIAALARCVVTLGPWHPS